MTDDTPAAKAAGAYHHGDLRQAVLDAALAKVDAEGADRVSLAAIARDLGVSQAAPYRHFPDRDRLLAAIAAEGFSLFTKALVDASSGLTGRVRLSRMCRAYVEFGLARTGLYRLMFASPVLTGAKAGDALKSAASASFDLLVDALPSSATPVRRRRRALRIWVALHGIVMLASQKLLGGPGATSSLDELIEDILE